MPPLLTTHYSTRNKFVVIFDTRCKSGEFNIIGSIAARCSVSIVPGITKVCTLDWLNDSNSNGESVLTIYTIGLHVSRVISSNL